MATIHKLTKNGSTIFPATITDAVVHPQTGKTLTSMMKEYNVSELFPTEGVDGGNKYNLALAVQVLGTHLSAEQKTGGIKLTFISSVSPYPEEEYFLGKSSWSSTAADWDQRFEVGDVVANPSGSWTPSTAEAYIDQQVGTINTNLASETIARQTGDANLSTQLQSEMATRADQDANLNALINAGIREGGGVQFDTVPTQNSANGITSGGMYSTLKDSNVGFVDEVPTVDSNNLVKSGGVDKNLSIELKFTPNRYINFSGNVGGNTSATYTATLDYYPVVAGMTYQTNIRCAANTNTCIAFYDENKVFLSYVNVVNEPFTVPSGAKYARFSDFNNTTRTYRYIKPEFNDTKDIDMFILSQLEAAKSDLNRYYVTSSLALTYNRFIDSFGNTRAGTANYAITTMTKVVAGSTVTVGLSANAPHCYHAFYDKSGNFISSVQGVTEMTIPKNACYAVFSGYVANTSLTAVSMTKVITNVYTIIEDLAIALQVRIDGGIGSSIVCWGDSLTQGAGSDMTHNLSTVLGVISNKGLNTVGLDGGCNYPTALSKFIGKTVYERGVGGENLRAIACRASANLLYNNTEITIPAGGSAVFDKNILKYYWNDGPQTFAWQHSEGAYNPCYINGVKCQLNKQDDTYYTLSLYEASANAFVIKANTPITLGGVQLKNPEWVVLWVGTNGGYDGMQDFINRIDMMIQVINPKNFIIVSAYAWNIDQVDSVTSISHDLQSRYGSYYLNLQHYLTNYALQDFGITPTTDADLTTEQLNNGVISDVNCMAAGILPSSLWRWCYGVDGKTQNDLHLNAAGYAIVAYKIYELMKINKGESYL